MGVAGELGYRRKTPVISVPPDGFRWPVKKLRPYFTSKILFVCLCIAGQ